MPLQRFGVAVICGLVFRAFPFTLFAAAVVPAVKVKAYELRKVNKDELLKQLNDLRTELAQVNAVASWPHPSCRLFRRIAVPLNPARARIHVPAGV